MSDHAKDSDASENESPNLERRSFLTAGIRLSLAATLLHTASAHATQCVNPEDLSSADYQFRKYVEYTESSSKPDKTCAGCAFFKQGQSECGSCQVVAGSINAHGYCTSWSVRVEKK